MKIVEMKIHTKVKYYQKGRKVLQGLVYENGLAFLESDSFNKYKLRYILIRYNIT